MAEAALLPVELKNFADRLGRLKQWPVRRKLQLIAVAYLATRFERAVAYREREVNRILDDWALFRDAPLLRRSLVDLGYLVREPDGSRYWVAAVLPDRESRTVSA